MMTMGEGITSVPEVNILILLCVTGEQRKNGRLGNDGIWRFQVGIHLWNGPAWGRSWSKGSHSHSGLICVSGLQIWRTKYYLKAFIEVMT